jgi:DNA-binding SARP family transcriptional activator
MGEAMWSYNEGRGLDLAPVPQHAGSSNGQQWPILVCVLGDFRVLHNGRPVVTSSGAKSKALLCALALRYGQRVPSGVLIDAIWPEKEPALASQSLHSLIHGVNRLFRDAIDGAAFVARIDGCYTLNSSGGVGADVAWFEASMREGEQAIRSGDRAAAAAAFAQAAGLYRGDICTVADDIALFARERLRNLHLSALAHLTEFSFDQGEYELCLTYAQQMVATEPCREDAHRIAMRAYVRMGQRAQALRQYRLCESSLQTEFDALPERATTALFERVRCDPHGI